MKYYILVAQFGNNGEIVEQGTYAKCLNAMKNEDRPCYIERFADKAEFEKGDNGEIIKTKGWQ